MNTTTAPIHPANPIRLAKRLAQMYNTEVASYQGRDPAIRQNTIRAIEKAARIVADEHPGARNVFAKVARLSLDRERKIFSETASEGPRSPSQRPRLVKQIS